MDCCGWLELQRTRSTGAFEEDRLLLLFRGGSGEPPWASSSLVSISQLQLQTQNRTAESHNDMSKRLPDERSADNQRQVYGLKYTNTELLIRSFFLSIYLSILSHKRATDLYQQPLAALYSIGGRLHAEYPSRFRSTTSDLS